MVNRSVPKTVRDVCLNRPGTACFPVECCTPSVEIKVSACLSKETQKPFFDRVLTLYKIVSVKSHNDFSRPLVKKRVV